MYIARSGDHYIIKRMPNSGSQHHVECDSYEPPAELSGLGEVSGSAIQEDIESGLTALKLDFSLSKTGGRKAPVASGIEPESVRADGAKEVLGLWLEQNEGAKFWLRVMPPHDKVRGVA